MAFKLEITRKPTKDIKPTDGRDWTKSERSKYYLNFGNNWTDFFMECKKILYNKYNMIFEEEISKVEKDSEKLKSFFHDNFSESADINTLVYQFVSMLNQANTKNAK